MGFEPMMTISKTVALGRARRFPNNLVPQRRLELSHLSILESKSSAATNYAKGANILGRSMGIEPILTESQSVVLTFTLTTA